MKAINWLIALVGILAIVSAVFFGVGASSATKPGSAIVLPDDYSSIGVTADGEVICFDTKSKSYLLGTAILSEYPPAGSPTDVIVVTSNVGIKESDLDKAARPEKDPKKSAENAREYEKKVNSLRPTALFHIHVLDQNTATIGVYQNRTSTWLKNLTFWHSRFQKEWRLIYSETYSRNRAQEIGKLVLEKIYKMKCQMTIG